MFEPIEYLQWYRNQPQADHDLGGTDLRPDHPDWSKMIPEALTDVADPPDETSAGSILADEYGVDEGNIVLASGARHAHLLAILTALGTADEEASALVENPAFEPLYSTPAGCGARVDRFERPAPRYELDAERVGAAIEHDTAFVTITNRHNPSGYRSDRAELAAVAEETSKQDAILVSDEVYAPYGSGADNGAFGGPTAAGLPNTIVIGSLTKFHGVGELRVGWLVVPDELREVIDGITMHFPTVGTPNVVLAERALSADRLIRRARRFIGANHELLTEFVSTRADLHGVIHAGATFGFIGHEDATGDDIVAAAREEGLIVVPGRFFGDPDRVRLGLGGEPDEMRDALERLDSALDRL